MVAVLPLLLYPILGFAVLQFALGFSEKPSVIGIVSETATFPAYSKAYLQYTIVPNRLAWLAALPGQSGSLCGALALTQTSAAFEYPPLLAGGQFTPLSRRDLQDDPQLFVTHLKLKLKWLGRADTSLLEDKTVDLLVEAPADFYSRLELSEVQGGPERPVLKLTERPDDDRSRQARQRFNVLLGAWKADLKQTRLARMNLPSTFDDPFQVEQPARSTSTAVPENLFGLMIRIFPFMLVMWSLAGALYPAVDLCAGEKERGTMETLLITPAAREEIVLGKFLTIWVFSAGSALLNLLSMGITTWKFGAQILQGSLPVGALLWSVVLSLPLSALFSAVSLAIGAYARSSKEGQYYLMPLFLVTMPLIFLTLAPGVELNPFYSLVPVTGVALLMQRLMTATSIAQVPWLYFFPVLLPIALYSWLALRWAIEQFKREEVLFREAERLDVKLWLQSLFREKQPTPTYGEAFFCCALILGLTWLAGGLGKHLPRTVHSGVRLLAFVAPTPLLMALLLNTRPREGLFLRLPSLKELGLAAVLAVLLIPPMAGLTLLAFEYFPDLTRLLEEGSPIFQELRQLREGGDLTPHFWAFQFAFAFLPAVCEELAFRGFILSGLLRRLRPRTAIVLCSFFFALYHMNVFQFLPSFFLGVVLGLLTVRSKSLLPAILFHFLHNGVLLSSIHIARLLQDSIPPFLLELWPFVIGGSLLMALALLWWLYRKPYVELERKLALEEASETREV